MTYYPSNDPHTECTKCNNGEDMGDGTKGTDCSRKNTGSAGTCNKGQSCANYCNVAANNNCDSKAQTFCNLGVQYIKDHADVGAYPIDEIQKDDIIYQKWTASKWNSLVNKLDTASGLGVTSSHGGAGPSVGTISQDDIITANLYNTIEAKIAKFNTSYNTVTGGPDGTIISATVANAMRTGYNNATFNSSVCDICNTTARQTPGTCSCNCTSCSACSSCPSCPSCSCSCSCNCTSCACNCTSCPCNCTTCATPTSEGGSSDDGAK